MARTRVKWAWRKERDTPQHLALTSRGQELATYCNRYWVQDHVRKDWELSTVQHPDKRPCLLCIGWLARNGASHAALIHWMLAEAGRTRPSTPQARYLKAV